MKHEFTIIIERDPESECVLAENAHLFEISSRFALGFEHGCSRPMDGCARASSACPRMVTTRSGRSSRGFSALCLCREERFYVPSGA